MPHEAVREDLVQNYDDVWAYEPRQLRIMDIELWNRGVPRAAMLYGIVGFAALLLLAQIPVIGLPLATLPLRWRVPLSAAAATATAWWLWKLPPGGVVPHRAAKAVLRGLYAPKHLHGWTAAAPRARDWAPDSLVLERDGRGRTLGTALTFTGPGRVAMFWQSEQVIERRGRLARLRRGHRAPARTFTLLPGRSRTTPQVLAIPAGVRVAFKEPKR